jgi:hypothetical protein
MPRYSWPIVWIEDGLGIKPEGRKREICISPGICGYSKEVAFFSSGGLAMMILQNVNVHSGRCFDDKWCLNLKCPFNKTNFQSYRKGSSFSSKKMTKANFEKLVGHRDWIEDSLRSSGWYEKHSIEHAGVYGKARGKVKEEDCE